LIETDLEWCNLDGCTLHQAVIQRTLLPLHALSKEDITDAITHGKQLRMSQKGW